LDTISPATIASILSGYLQEYDSLPGPGIRTENPNNCNFYGNRVPRADFQAILTILARGTATTNTPPYLFAVDLSGADLQNARFEGANLYGSFVAGACFVGPDGMVPILRSPVSTRPIFAESPFEVPIWTAQI
jgi:uncharacterized protein YjbI with pentapeptide repeats